MDRWTWVPKRVPEDSDGVPRRSLLAELALDPRSGIVLVKPGVYRTRESAVYPRG